MTVLKRIGPASAFKVGFLAYALLGLVGGLFCSMISLTGVAFAAHSHMPWMGRIGVFAVVVCPIVYGIFGGILSLVSAVVYNLAASWVGGLEVNI